MVRYSVERDASHVSLHIVGHASEYGAARGNNLVCAAVSTVADMVCEGCLYYDPDTAFMEADGELFVSCRTMPETVGIMTAAMLEMERIKENYPDCFKKGESL